MSYNQQQSQQYRGGTSYIPKVEMSMFGNMLKTMRDNKLIDEDIARKETQYADKKIASTRQYELMKREVDGKLAGDVTNRTLRFKGLHIASEANRQKAHNTEINQYRYDKLYDSDSAINPGVFTPVTEEDFIKRFSTGAKNFSNALDKIKGNLDGYK